MEKPGREIFILRRLIVTINCPCQRRYISAIAGRRSFDDLNLRVVDMHQHLAQVAHIEPVSQPGHFPK
jgi:hypothetical protein